MGYKMGTLARNGLITLLLNNPVTKVYLAFSMIFKPSLTILHNCHCVKSVQIRSNFWSVFCRIWIEYGRYFVSLHIESECGKIRAKNQSVFGHFSRSVFMREGCFFQCMLLLIPFILLLDLFLTDLFPKSFVKFVTNLASL